MYVILSFQYDINIVAMGCNEHMCECYTTSFALLQILFLKTIKMLTNLKCLYVSCNEEYK